MITEGEAEEKDLEEALNELSDQFFSEIGDSGYKTSLRESKHKQLLYNKILQANLLSEVGDNEGLMKLTRSKTTGHAIAIYKKWLMEYNKLSKKKNPEESNKTDYFDELQTLVTTHFKMWIPDSATVYEFACLVKRYNKEIEQLKQNNNGKHNRHK